MKDFLVTIRIRAECEADAHELIQQYTGENTSVEILNTNQVEEETVEFEGINWYIDQKNETFITTEGTIGLIEFKSFTDIQEKARKLKDELDHAQDTQAELIDLEEAMGWLE